MKYLIIILSLIVLTSCVDESAFDEIDAVDSVIMGKNIIIKTDTLEIINRDFWSGDITLSNGLDCSYEYVFSKLDVETTMKIDSITNYYKDKK